MERRTHYRRDVLTEAEAARVGDVFTTHQRFIESVARQHAPGPDHVPDIVQAVGIQVCRGLNGFREEAQIRTWLFRVTVNTARDYYRAERRHLRAVEAVQVHPVPEPVIDPDDQAFQAERVAALRAAIQQLKPFYQDLMRNQLLSTAVQTGSKASRHRARRQLKQLLLKDPRLEF